MLSLEVLVVTGESGVKSCIGLCDGPKYYPVNIFILFYFKASMRHIYLHVYLVLGVSLERMDHPRSNA